MKTAIHAASCLLIATLSACNRIPPLPRMDAAAHRADVEAWRAYRYDLLAREGWAALTGLYWLESGPNTIGGAEASDIQFRGRDLPDRIGVLTVGDSSMAFEVAPGVSVLHDTHPVSELTIVTAAHPDTTILSLGSLAWHVIERGDRFAVRVLDSQAPTLLAFDSIPSYALSVDWRLAARFDRYDPPKPIMVPNVLGTVNESPSPGAVVFRVGGETYRLDVLGKPADSTFWIQFGDGTNGIETYGGGRYIWVDAPKDGDAAVIDFNKSYNPPCVFTPYATCPLPPQQNKLPIRIEAGELTYGH